VYRKPLVIVLAAATIIGTAAGCSSGSSKSSTNSGGSNSSGKSVTISVAYEKFGPSTQLDALFKTVKPEYEAAHPGYKVNLEPIQAAENDYYTKLDLMNRSSSTAPDVLYEDTFLVNSDISAGYLAPIDTELSKWSDWSQFTAASKAAGQGTDGKSYGVPMGTDTRALWYNKQIFAKAGIPVPWQPKNWADILSAAQTIKSKVPGVTPLNVYSGKGAGEGSTMQGFEMLLYGTKDTLYDAATKKWVTSSKGMTDSLNFVRTVYSDKLGPDPQDALNPNIGTTIATSTIPSGKLGIDLDGSWLTGNWKAGPGVTKPWTDWNTVMGEAAMPTQDGQAPGTISMSGGWLLSVGSKSKNQQAAFDFISLALNKENSLAYDKSASQIAERADVAADPSYISSDPTVNFFTNLVKVTHFRPAYTAYPKISDAIQVAMEAVMTNQSSTSSAEKAFASTVKGIVGAANTTTGS
jgi:multiple sugar transport system substrate-binding protein